MNPVPLNPKNSTEITDYFTMYIDLMAVKCPVHGTPMRGKRVEIRTGYVGILRMIMYSGVCPEKDCNKWFEYHPLGDMILWP